MIDKKEINDRIEQLLEKAFVVIDFLPEQVSEDKGNNFARTEAFFLQHKDIIYRHFAYLIIKLSSYYDLIISDGVKIIEDFDPARLYDLFLYSDSRTCLNILFREKDSLITFYGDDLYMTVYNADDSLLELLRQLSLSEQLFVR